MQTTKEQNTNNEARIQQLNDRLRKTHTGGRIMLTIGIRSLETSQIANIMQAIANFSQFTPRNDPHSEHDCATLEVEGIHILWKIDYYDESLSLHSPDPADPNVTVRILTVMTVDEY